MDTRLAVCGLLAPGCESHGRLAGLNGRWSRGTVRGHLAPTGWGAALGDLGPTLDPDGPLVEVQMLESADLPAHWARLDVLEGDGYRRVATPVVTDTGEVTASIYEIVPEGLISPFAEE